MRQADAHTHTPTRVSASSESFMPTRPEPRKSTVRADRQRRDGAVGLARPFGDSVARPLGNGGRASARYAPIEATGGGRVPTGWPDVTPSACRPQI
jgi:hypothetical protein